MAFSSPVLWGLARGRGIRNDTPDKGTETLTTGIILNPVVRLEMITPIRGRKPATAALQYIAYSSIRNDNPDKGTETSICLWRPWSITTD